MDALNLLLLLLAGCLAGFLAGFFGVGGGIILVPILLYYFHSIGVSSLVATHLTFGTSLLIVIFASLTSAVQYSRNRHVVWKAVLYIGVASVAGALLGTTIAGGLQGKSLQRIFAVVVTFAAVRLLVEKKITSGEPAMNLSPVRLILIGLIVGLVSSLAGVGGGIFSIPMMHYMMKFPLKKSLGTSSATIVITALAATLGYIVRGWGNTLLPSHTLGFVDYLHAVPIIVGTLPFATLGAWAAHRTKGDVLQKAFAVFLLAVAMKMFFL